MASGFRSSIVQEPMFLILLLNQVCHEKTNAINRIIVHEQKDRSHDRNGSSGEVNGAGSRTCSGGRRRMESWRCGLFKGWFVD